MTHYPVTTVMKVADSKWIVVVGAAAKARPTRHDLKTWYPK